MSNAANGTVPHTPEPLDEGLIMYIDPKGQIAGFPAIRIRDLLRGLSRIEMWTVDYLKERLHVPKCEASEVLQKLEVLGYIEPKSTPGDNGFWTTTLKGNALGLASAARPFSRTTANRVVKELLDRARNVNAESYYLFRVKKVVVFGSFLSEKEKLNDVDIGVYLERKEADMDKHMALCRERSMLAMQHGRRLNTYLEELFWAEQEVLKFLKSRSRSISLHHDDTILQRVKTRTLFEEC